MKSVRFDYLYRDGSNYKNWGSVVFSNPGRLTKESISNALRECFLQECLFIADQVRIPECFLFADKLATSDDHCFHEFEVIDTTTEPPDDLQSRSISQFVWEVKRAFARGWTAFDVHENKAS